MKAFGIFSDKTKAIAFCLARFDDDTKEAFLNLYSKVDADMAPAADEATASTENSECPW